MKRLFLSALKIVFGFSNAIIDACAFCCKSTPARLNVSGLGIAPGFFYYCLSRIVKFAFVPVIILVCFNGVYAQTTYYDNYAFRIPLTLNNASLGISTDQTNFVALIKVTSPNFVSAVCSDQTGGISSTVPQFAIIDSAYSTTSELYYQVENYNTTTGVIYFWVRIPTLYKTGSSKGSNKLYCYFGSTNPSVTHDASWQKLTWSNTTSANVTYSGVWHFNEDPTGPAPQFEDATVNDNNLSVGSYLGSSGTVTQNTSSQIGNGISLNATSVLDTSAVNMPNTQNSQSMSIWVSYPSIATSYSANFIVLENGSDPASSGNGTQLGVSVRYKGISTPTLQAWRWANEKTPLVYSYTIPSVNTWHYLAYTYNASTKMSYLYLDGALLTSASNSSNPPYSGSVNMVSFGDYINNQTANTPPGPKKVGGQSYTGTMDESHVIGTTLSADWIKAEYVNQSNPDAFTTAGSMQTNSARASAVAGYLVYTWKGVNTDITNANNWDNTTTGVSNEAPVNGNVNWVIPAGLSNYPVLTADTALYGLTIASGASINLNGHTLKVGCNIYNSSGGQILYGSNTGSKITWDGSISSQYYYGTNTTLTCQVGSMEVDNSSAGTINISGGPVDIFNTLTITKGNLAIGSSPAALTLKSTSALTASVAAIPAAYSITGNVNVERYISGGSNTYRAYRILSSAVHTATSGSNYYYDLSYLPHYAPVTGSAGTSGGLTKTGNPSMYLYRDNVAFTNSTFNTGNFRGISNINNSPLYAIGVDYDGTYNLHVGTGILFFYRGDTTNIATKYITTTSAEPNVFVSTGVLNQQAITVVNWYTQLPQLQYSVVPGNAGYSGFNLVGNPYASSIDWDTYSTTSSSAGIYAPNVGPTIYIFNPVTKVYATYSGGIGLNGGSNIIPSGQGFFVQATSAGTPTLTFNESAKTNAQLTGPTQGSGTTLLLSSMANPNALQLLRVQLYKDSVDNEETVIRFNSKASDNFSINEDSRYLPGTGGAQFCSFSADSVPVAINELPLPKKQQLSVRLKVNVKSDGQYQLNLTQLTGIPDIYDVWLMDDYKKDSLDIKHNPSYRFDVSLADTNSYRANRFRIVVRENPGLGVHLLAFRGAKKDDGAKITWTTENEYDYTNFTLERSSDGGTTFTPLTSFVSGNSANYNYLDGNPPLSTDMYRLKITDLNGTVTYSDIVTLMYANPAVNTAVKSDITLYPNPAQNILHLTITPVGQNTGSGFSPSGGQYNIQIVSVSGETMKKTTINQPHWQTDISGLMPGTYVLQVINAGSEKVVGQSSFVKL